MNGIFIIDKPAGITSHDVVAKVRRILKIKRVGHTGTLDPFATGVMVILVGQATRLAQFIDKDEKEYEALVRFGFETDTGDRTGLRRRTSGTPKEEPVSRFAHVAWDKVFDEFLGETEQVPPMFSAKKVEGKKLYEHARKGETIERRSVKVTIHELQILGSALRTSNSELRLRVICSAGTYIRTLAEDIGRKVGTFAHLSELRRTRAGKFTIEQSLTLEQLENLDNPDSALISMNEAVSHLPEFALAVDRIEKTKNGLSTRVSQDGFKDGDTLRMTDISGNVIAIGVYKEEERSIHPTVVLV